MKSPTRPHKPVTFAILLVLALILPPAGYSQFPVVQLPTIKQLPVSPGILVYLRPLEQKLAAWNAGRIKFQKAGLESVFGAEIAWRTQVKPLNEENEQWRKTFSRQWEALPRVLEPKAKLSQGAINILLTLYQENVPQVSKAVLPQQLEQLLILDFALYPILATAQEAAISAGSPTITAQMMVGALIPWWTEIWPFCSVPRKDAQYRDRPTRTPTRTPTPTPTKSP